MSDTETTINVPTNPLDSNPPNTFTEPANEDPVFVANQTFEGLASIPEDPTQNKLAVYYTDIVPIAYDELDGLNDSFTPTDSNGTYVPPSITFSSASSTNFPFEGSVTTIITGVSLDQVSHVRIQSTNCTFVVNSSTQLTVTIPVCPDNDASTLKTLDFYDVYNALAFSVSITYDPQVQVFGITSIDVNSGSLLGNTIVTITGGAFFFISRVIFDGTDVYQFEIINSTTIQCTTAKKKDAFTGIPGSVQVIDYFNNIVTLPNAYTYVFPDPFILGLSINSGSIDGGDVCIIAGAYFLNVTNVTLGGIPVTYNVDSETQITFTTNAGTYTGISLDLVITTLYGTTTYISAFTYSAPNNIPYPTITSVSVNAGNVIGGTTFEIYGTNLDNVTGVTIGTFPVTSFVIVSSTRLTCVSGAGVYTGTSLDIILNSPFGNVTRTNAFTYTYDPPTLSTTSISTSNMIGGDTVILTGTNFYLVSNVVMCGLEVASFVVNSPTQITVVTPVAINVADTLGNIDVVATFGTVTLPNSYTFFSVLTPVVTFSTPSSGSTAGGTLLILNGTNFLTTTSITVDGNSASFVIDSNIQLTVTIPVASAFTGLPVDVIVTNTFGSFTAVGIFTYTQPTPIISTVTPTTRNVSGGSSIVLNGSFFLGTTSVQIDGVNATSYIVNSTTQITAVIPSSIYTNTAVPITVTTPAGTGTLSGVFTYLPSPTISSVSPNTCLLAGGVTITITGVAFTNTSSVTIGGIAVTSYTVNTASQITAVVPAGVSVNTPYDIVIVTTQGTYTGTGLFTYLNAPTVSSVSPNTGATAGGNTITIVGTNFNNATVVKIGTTNVTSYTIDSSTQITAVTPSGSVGSAQTITVETPQGNVTSGTGLFSYLNAPTVSSVSPNTGTTVGGNSVVITGTNFTNATAVKIGTTNVASYTVDSSTQITAVTPSGSTGSAQTITVETPQGNVTSGSGLFTYLNAPTVSTVTPNTGATVGGNTITIVGTNFNNATAVKIGTTNVASFIVNSSTQITAVTPSGSVGSAQTITVETPQGNVTSGSGLFSYLNAPTISTVTPNTGATAGGNSVVIIGTNFTNASVVKIGTTNVASYTVDSSTQITAVTPSGSVGSAQTITVETPQGNVTSGSGLFSYLNTPTITTVSPNTGATAGGNSVVITGTNFTNATAVQIGTTNVTSYTVDSSTQITAVTPAGTVGAKTITVETPQGNVTSGASLFSYLNSPTVSTVSPNTGATAGGNTITIVGTNFTNATAVKIGTTNVASYTVDSATQITAVTPSGSVGSAQTITVETPQGNVTSGSGLFTYLNAPTITIVSPISGNVAGGDSIVITGTNFTNATAVKIGTTSVTSYTVDSATQITAVTPAGSTGSAQTITVETPQGNVTSGSGLFTYYNTPTVTSVSPTSGAAAGGDTITIVGTNFNNATDVKIDTTSVASFTVDSSTQITAVTSAGTGSNLTISVITPQGTGTSATGIFSFTSGPSLTLVSPTSGFTTGGTVLTVIGTGFQAGDTLTIDGNAATSVTVVSSTKITCNTPSGTTGAKNVVLNGSVTLTSAFTYLTPAFNKSRYRTFTSQTVPAGSATYFHDVTYNATLGLFAAVAQFSSGTDGIITSPNGTTWTRRTSPFTEGNNSYLRIVANSTRFLTSGNNANENATSTNGTTWTNVTGIQGIHSLAYSDTLNVWVVPQLNKIWYSTNDGSTWSSTNVTVYPLGCIWAGTPFNKFFLFPRENGNILYSSNGSTWTTVTPGLNTTLFYYAAAYSSDLQKILIIANTGQTYESTNGTTWSLIGTCSLVGDKRSLIWNGNLQCWFLSGSTGVAISANGIRWSRIATYTTDTNPDFTSKGIAYSPSLDVFVTAQASMYKSDGALKGSILFGNNNYLTCANSADFQFGTGDFTIEWYQYQTTISGTQRVFSYGTQIAGQITSAGAFEVILNNVTVYTQSLTNYYESQWRHIAITRQGTSLRVFYDGTQLGTTVTNSTNVGNASTVFCIGNASTPVSGSSFLGKITNFHVLKGTALYTTTFSKPTEDIIAETTNSYTKLLLPAPSTNFILDYSGTPKIISNTGCTADSASPYY